MCFHWHASFGALVSSLWVSNTCILFAQNTAGSTTQTPPNTTGWGCEHLVTSEMRSTMLPMEPIRGTGPRPEEDLPSPGVPLTVGRHLVGKRALAQVLQAPHHRPSVHQGFQCPLQGRSSLRLGFVLVFKKKKKKNKHTHMRISVRSRMIKVWSVPIVTALLEGIFG